MANMGTIDITYLDGSTETVEVLPIGLMMAERKFGADWPPVEGMFFIAWTMLKPGVPFDDWVSTIASAKDNRPTEAAVDPTTEAPSAAP